MERENENIKKKEMERLKRKEEKKRASIKGETGGREKLKVKEYTRWVRGATL